MRDCDYPLSINVNNLPVHQRMKFVGEVGLITPNPIIMVRCFLDASTHLYMMVCPSVRPSVCRWVTRFFKLRILSGNGI